MANRFLDTNYYKSPFVRSLEGPLKTLYSFIICDCDGSGIWNLDLDAATLYTGFKINKLDFERNFVKTGKAIPIGGSKYFFPDFIEHQYPSGLQEANKAHKNFIKTLKKYDLLDENLKIKTKEAARGFISPLGLGQGNGLGKGLGDVIAQDAKIEAGEGLAIYDAEQEILKNQIEFERICVSVGADLKNAKDSLRKYHLFLEEKEQYPKGKKAVFAGFEKWLLNEKKFTKNGTTKNHRVVGKDPVDDKL